jgi:membrane protein YqaA with SNARE-associated domain
LRYEHRAEKCDPDFRIRRCDNKSSRMAGLIVVSAWAFAEAVLLFIVADVPISALALRRGWGAGWRAALIAALFAALGGLVTIAWAQADPTSARAAIEALPGVSPALLDETAEQWAEKGFAAMLSGSFSGTPYKLYALAAAGDGTGPARFFVMSVLARLPRFLLVAALFAVIGRVLRPRLSARFIAVLFVLGWCGFYAWYFAAMG